MTASDLQSLLVTTLMREHGGDRRRWRLVLGEVKVYSLATHPHCNWSVTPSGAFADIDAVETLVDQVRAQHPIVTTR
ncbi:hypothetical protein [Sphingomonas sp. R86521]|uniref:hypothetical protein n=1 Tax=Sphingomonas sp. R86521 TaxID=3093860 RepID=UPI00120F39FD|nr:MAG: hypothetical protein EOP67_54335 [Sphingomonas sp.]